MNNSATFKKVLKQIRPYRLLLVLSLMLAAVYVILSLYLPILLGDAVNLIVKKGKVNFSSLIPILYKMGIIAVVASVFQWVMEVINNKISYNVVRDLRNKAFEKLQVLPLSYLDTRPSGSIISKIISDAEMFGDGLLLGFSQIFIGVVSIVGTLIFMLGIQPRITLVVVLLTPISFFIAKFIAKRSYNYFNKQARDRAKQTEIVDEMIGNQRVVQAFNYRDSSQDIFDKSNVELKESLLKASFFSSLINPSTRFVNTLVYAAVALYGAILVIGGSFSVGMLSSFLAYSTQYSKPFNEISGVIAEFQNALACSSRLFELIEQKEEVPDPQNPKVIENVSGEVTAEGVYFSYTKDRELIKDFNLHAESGKKIAIVGPTGCGKTTLINLIMRFYEVNEGAFYIDGVKTTDLTRKNLRSSFGMVLQDTWLKEGTIKDNIKMGNENASDEEVIKAAKMSHAHSFIRRLTNGYDTQIGTDGGGLSIGQKQLLCIARVMLTNPQMLILDEATSSIDTRTEIKIQDAFNTLMKGKTSFIVAHRLSTIKSADLILVMDKGNVIEQGTHEELLAQNGFYSNLYNSQFAV